MQKITNSLCFNSCNNFEFSKYFGVTKHLLWINWGFDFIGKTNPILKESIDDLIKPVFSQPIVVLVHLHKRCVSFNIQFCHLKHCSLTEQLHVKMQLNYYVKIFTCECKVANSKLFQPWTKWHYLLRLVLVIIRRWK